MTKTPEPAGAQDMGLATIDMREGAWSIAVQSLEKQFISYALTRAGGNKAEAARLAGMSYDTFLRRLARYNLRVTYHVA